MDGSSLSNASTASCQPWWLRPKEGPDAFIFLIIAFHPQAVQSHRPEQEKGTALITTLILTSWNQLLCANYTFSIVLLAISIVSKLLGDYIQQGTKTNNTSNFDSHINN